MHPPGLAARRILSGALAALCASCAQQESAQAPTVSAQTTTTATAATIATTTATATATTTTTATATATASDSALGDAIASAQEQLAALRAELDRQGNETPRCVLDAKTAAALAEERAKTQAAADAYGSTLDVFARESRAIAASLDAPTRPVRIRDLRSRLGELVDQIRRAYTRAVLLGDTMRACP
jgi:hypothetical protein